MHSLRRARKGAGVVIPDRKRGLMAVRAEEHRGAPRLVSTAGLLELYPAIKPRTLRYWIENAAPKVAFEGGQQKEIPGNGLGPAVIRKGRVVLVDVDRFREWLFEGQVAG